jgi:hypothetical protein
MIEKAILDNGYEVGIVSGDLHLLNKKQVKEIIKMFGNAYTIQFTINRKRYIVEVEVVENEIDVMMLTRSQYQSKYDIDDYNMLERYGV